MNYLVIILRLIHILSGVFWVGSAIFSGFIIFPAVGATGEAGKQFMGYLVTKAKISQRIGIAAALTVLAGGALYWIDSDGLKSSWTTAGPGLGFGIGGLLALLGFVLALLSSIDRATLIKLAGQLGNGKPAPEQMNQILTLQKRSNTLGLIGNIALILALACMATARYWHF